ncbi:MAG: hypothetical protein WAU02_01755 [Candidatus Saccharimonadales bacterium]
MNMLKAAVVALGGLVIVASSALLSYTVMNITVGKTQPVPQSPVPVGQTVLTISEWGVAMPLTDTIKDAKYYMSPTLGQDTITVTSLRATELLGKVQGCHSGLYGPSIHRVEVSQKMTERKVYLLTKSYRFEQALPIEPACLPTDVPQELRDILNELNNAVEKMYQA